MNKQNQHNDQSSSSKVISCRELKYFFARNMYHGTSYRIIVSIRSFKRLCIHVCCNVMHLSYNDIRCEV